MVIYTIGHSTHPIAEFITILQKFGIQELVDIRTVPRSRKNPQFNWELLPHSLLAAGIAYTHLPGLGGLRHARADSTNTAWRNKSFRGYADYMQTQEFEDNLDKLIEMAGERRAAIMCAEALHWRCHRSLVADALTARGISVEHIFVTGQSSARAQPHRMTPFAHVEGARPVYN